MFFHLLQQINYPMRYEQKNITITKEQQDFIRANKKIGINQLAKMLGLSLGKTHHNMTVMGLTKPRKSKVIKMEGYFDVEDFGKFYNY